MTNASIALATRPPAAPAKLYKSQQSLAIRENRKGQADYVPHLGLAEIQRLAAAAEANGRGAKGQRDRLMIETLFDGALRVSEGLRLRPLDLIQTPAGWKARILGKGDKPGEVALSPSIAAKLQAWAYQRSLPPGERFFPVTAARAWQILARAFDEAGIAKPDHVGAVHVLRHSGAIARLALTGNPKAVQDQLRHVDASMTLRYLKTLSAQQSLEIQQTVDFNWR